MMLLAAEGEMMASPLMGEMITSSLPCDDHAIREGEPRPRTVLPRDGGVEGRRDEAELRAYGSAASPSQRERGAAYVS